MNQLPTIAATTRIVLIWAGVRIDIDRGILGFRSQQIAQIERPHPIGDDAGQITTYHGWSIQIAVERFNNKLDRLFYDVEQAYSNGGGSPWSVPAGIISTTDPDTGKVTQTRVCSAMPGRLYQYITEPDGSITTLEFGPISGFLADAGNYQMGQSVVQVLDLFASRRKFI